MRADQARAASHHGALESDILQCASQHAATLLRARHEVRPSASTGTDVPVAEKPVDVKEAIAYLHSARYAAATDADARLAHHLL